MPELGLNIDHIATLREARYRGWKKGLPPEPQLLPAALLAEQAGATSITVHLREDRRHIQDADVKLLRQKITTRLNLEMAATPAMTQSALKLKPDDVCLVPENRREVTTEGGLDVAGDLRKLATVTKKLKRAGIEVSVFIDADLRQIRAAHQIGADAVELHTGTYANCTTAKTRQKELARHAHAAALAHGLDLKVNAGHGLHYTNLEEYLENVPHVQTLNIGHAIISRAVFTGLEPAVEEMIRLIRYRESGPNAD